ncbi:MAG: hypothetical protein WBV39_05820, partial [Rudaea sp.]
ALTITSHTDSFIASPVVSGNAEHVLSENAATIQSASALTSVFADSRLVDVGDNPGAIALWANAVGVSDALDWSGAQHELHGAVHSNSDIRLNGAQSLMDGPVHYVSSLTVNGSQNTFTLQPRQVSAQPLPTLLDLSDFAPGGPVAAATGAAYYDESAECASKHSWQRSKAHLQLASGVYWIPCDVHLSGSNMSGPVTLVSTGTIQISGAKGTFQPYYQGVQFATSSASSDALHLSGSSAQIGGLVFAPQGTVQLTGASMDIRCAVIADQIRMAGAKTTIDPQQCAYATVQRQAPAVLWNGYGSGVSAYAAFDWLAAIDQNEGTTPGALTNLFDGVLASVAPNQIVLRTGSVVPLTATVTSNADPFQGLLTLGADDDSTFVPPMANWNLDFSNPAPFQVQTNVRLGNSANSGLSATVASTTPVAIDPLAQSSLSIPHVAGESIDALIAALTATTDPDAGIGDALTAMQAAKAAQAANDTEGTLQRLLDAAEACGRSTNTQADALRTRIDWVIWANTL